MTDSKAEAKESVVAKPVAAAVATKAVAPRTLPVARFIPSGAAPRLLFGAKFFAHLGTKALTLYEATNLGKVLTMPLKAPRGVGALADGGVVALDETAPGEVTVVQVSAHKATKRYPAVVSTTEHGLSRLFGDPRAALDFWVLSPGALVTLEGLRLTMVAGALETTSAQQLPEAAARTLTVLADGAVFYYDAPSVKRVGTAGKPAASYRLPEAVGALFHLVPGSAAGTLTAADDQGRVHWLALDGDSAKVTHTEDCGAVVYALDGSDAGVAALLVADAAANQARWTAVVWDGAGKELVRLPVPWLPSAPPVGELTVRLSATHLAVGSAERFVVWERSSQKPKLTVGL